MKITENRYLEGFGIAVILLALVRCAFPGVAGSSGDVARADSLQVSGDSAVTAAAVTEETPAAEQKTAPEKAETPATAAEAEPVPAKDDFRPHRIYSVPNYRMAFPDQNDVQLTAAEKYGVSPVADRDEAESRKSELVFVGANPYYFVDRLNNSIPYLVPRAADLLQEIGQNFFDSLYVKGVPLHKIIVTSVLRTGEDVTRLRGHNGNATQNSCHLYGTTFDICYNRYKTVSDPDGPALRAVSNDTLKWVLSEVLNDLRQRQRCYIKYEVKQGCFHLTVR